MDAEKQKRIIRYLVETLTKCNRENLVYERFVQELKDGGRVGILEDLHRIRRSEEIQSAQDTYFRSLDALIAEANGEIKDQVLRDLIRQQRLGKDIVN